MPAEVLPFGFWDVAQRLSLTVSIVVAGGAVVLWQRKSFVGWLNSSARRFGEGLALLVSSGATGTIAAGIDFQLLLHGQMATEDTRLVWALSVATGVSLVVQLAVMLHADQAQKSIAEADAEATAAQFERDEAREERDLAAAINEACLKVVSRKRERVKAARSEHEVLLALAPAAQCQALIVACWEVLQAMVFDQTGEKPEIRVAFFEVAGPRLEPRYSYNGTHHDCVSKLIENNQATRARFRLDSRQACLAVAAAKSGTTFWVPDAEAANADEASPFVFFDPEEPKKLKSIVALPVKIQGDSPPYDVVTVDTDLVGFFNGADVGLEIRLNLVLKNLAHRLQLEKQLLTLLPEVPHARATPPDSA